MSSPTPAVPCIRRAGAAPAISEWWSERVEFWGALADEHASVALVLLILA